MTGQQIVSHKRPRAMALMRARSARGAGARLPWRTRRISKPRRLICIEKTRVMVSELSFAPGCSSGTELRSLSETKAFINEVPLASISDCNRFIHDTAIEKIEGRHFQQVRRCE